MNAECLILIARLCLPATVESVEFQSSPVGSAAVAHFKGATLRFDLWSDSLNPRNVGLTEYCEGAACVHFRTEAVAGPGVGRAYRLRLDGEGAERVLVIRADDRKTFESLAAATRIVAREGAPAIALSSLAGRGL